MWAAVFLSGVVVGVLITLAVFLNELAKCCYRSAVRWCEEQNPSPE